MADPGFPRGGGTNSLVGRVNIQFCQFFSPKTAWNWKNLDPLGVARPKFYYVDPPLIWNLFRRWKVRSHLTFLARFIKTVHFFKHCVNGDGQKNGQNPFCKTRAFLWLMGVFTLQKRAVIMKRAQNIKCERTLRMKDDLLLSLWVIPRSSCSVGVTLQGVPH